MACRSRDFLLKDLMIRRLIRACWRRLRNIFQYRKVFLVPQVQATSPLRPNWLLMHDISRWPFSRPLPAMVSPSCDRPLWAPRCFLPPRIRMCLYVYIRFWSFRVVIRWLMLFQKRAKILNISVKRIANIIYRNYICNLSEKFGKIFYFCCINRL